MKTKEVDPDIAQAVAQAVAEAKANGQTANPEERQQAPT